MAEAYRALTNLEESGEVNACSIAAGVNVGGETSRSHDRRNHNHPRNRTLRRCSRLYRRRVRTPFGRSYVYQACELPALTGDSGGQTLPENFPKER